MTTLMPKTDSVILLRAPQTRSRKQEDMTPIPMCCTFQPQSHGQPQSQLQGQPQSPGVQSGQPQLQQSQ